MLALYNKRLHLVYIMHWNAILSLTMKDEEENSEWFKDKDEFINFINESLKNGNNKFDLPFSVDNLLNLYSSDPWAKVEDNAINFVRTDEITEKNINLKEDNGIDQEDSIAVLWLNEIINGEDSGKKTESINRKDWIKLSSEKWISLAKSISKILSKNVISNIEKNLYEESEQESDKKIKEMLSKLSEGLLANRLSSLIGEMSHEIISSGDLILPLHTIDTPKIIIENFRFYTHQIETNLSELKIFLIIRERAYTNLMLKSKWVENYVYTLILRFIQESVLPNIDATDFEMYNDNFDIETLKEILKSEKFKPNLSDEQKTIHNKLSEIISLIEGWVDVVTLLSTHRLPSANAIYETVVRRRVTNSPIDYAMKGLIDLEIRPKEIREATNMWQKLYEEFDHKTLSLLWSHPDMLPNAEEIKNPEKIIERLKHKGLDDESFEDEIRKLFDQ